jgi:hypothetical protein
VDATEASITEWIKAGAKVPADTHVHIAVRVSNLEAVAALQAKNIGIQEPNIKQDSKAAYLDVTDPDGNPIHLLWTAKK